jgi:hypothetical protein
VSNDIRWAAKVADFLMQISRDQRDRWNNVIDTKRVPYPFGDMAYGAALDSWIRAGKPGNAFFSYAPDQMECPFLIEFKEELTKEFGLKVCTIEEGQELRRSYGQVNTVKVKDWGLN